MAAIQGAVIEVITEDPDERETVEKEAQVFRMGQEFNLQERKKNHIVSKNL